MVQATQLERDRAELGDPLSCFPWARPSHGSAAAPGGSMLRSTPAPTHTAGLAAWHSYVFLALRSSSWEMPLRLPRPSPTTGMSEIY